MINAPCVTDTLITVPQIPVFRFPLSNHLVRWALQSRMQVHSAAIPSCTLQPHVHTHQETTAHLHPPCSLCLLALLAHVGIDVWSIPLFHYVRPTSSGGGAMPSLCTYIPHHSAPSCAAPHRAPTPVRCPYAVLRLDPQQPSDAKRGQGEVGEVDPVTSSQPWNS